MMVKEDVRNVWKNVQHAQMVLLVVTVKEKIEILKINVIV